MQPKPTKVDTKNEPESGLSGDPEYVPLNHEDRDAVGLPAELCTSPLGVFNQLFPHEVWESLCNNTNAYYRNQSSCAPSELPLGDAKPLPWKDATVGELKVWLGLLLYMGVMIYPGIWTTKHRIMSAMSLDRFLQLRSYLHVSPPAAVPRVSSTASGASPCSSTISSQVPLTKPEPPTPAWWEKLEPMSSILQQRCKECYLPCSNVTVDEVTVKRLGDTPTMPHKPGHKLFALTDQGYTYGWIYDPKVKGATSKCMLRSQHTTAFQINVDT